jgi:hypothetical protein
MPIRTPISFSDLAVLTALLQKPLEKVQLVRRALAVAESPTFDAAVALATVDRLAGLGLLRKVRSRYELTQEGRDVLPLAMQDHREALEQMARLASPRLIDGPVRPNDTRTAA